MSNARGIDCSHWQTTTPSLTGLDFLVARATYATTPDDRYALHAANARKAGLIVGAYHFGVGAAQASIKDQAAAFVKAAATADFLALDLESNGKAGPSMTGSEAQAFIRAVRLIDKRKIGLYHSASGYPSLGQDFNWIAVWGNNAPTPKWTFWQYQGSPLDSNYFNGDRAALDTFVGLSTAGPAQPVEAPVYNFSPRPGPVGSFVMSSDPLVCYVNLATGVITPAPGVHYAIAWPVTLSPAVAGGKSGADRHSAFLVGPASVGVAVLASDGVFTPATADSTSIAAAVAADRAKAFVSWK